MLLRRSRRRNAALRCGREWRAGGRSSVICGVLGHARGQGAPRGRHEACESVCTRGYNTVFCGCNRRYNPRLPTYPPTSFQMRTKMRTTRRRAQRALLWQRLRLRPRRLRPEVVRAAAASAGLGGCMHSVPRGAAASPPRARRADLVVRGCAESPPRARVPTSVYSRPVLARGRVAPSALWAATAAAAAAAAPAAAAAGPTERAWHGCNGCVSQRTALAHQRYQHARLATYCVPRLQTRRRTTRRMTTRRMRMRRRRTRRRRSQNPPPRSRRSKAQLGRDGCDSGRPQRAPPSRLSPSRSGLGGDAASGLKSSPNEWRRTRRRTTMTRTPPSTPTAPRRRRRRRATTPRSE